MPCPALPCPVINQSINVNVVVVVVMRHMGIMLNYLYGGCQNSEVHQPR